MTVANLSDELAGCQFGDARLSKRVRKLADALGRKPNLSIPAAMETSKADIEACYRFFDNENVTPEKILQPHIQATYKRVDQLDFVLLAQDTSEIDLTRPEQQVDGAGAMDSEARRGVFYHPMIAFDASGVALGIVGQKCWTRETISKASKTQKQAKRRKTPIEDKESYRWIEGLQWAKATAAACPETMCVCVSDSESDIYDLFVAALASDQPNLHLLVRAGQNRNTTEQQDWADQVRKTAKIANQSVTIRARTAKVGEGKSARSRSREGRIAALEIRKATIEVCRPVHGDTNLPAKITLNVVLCEEVNPAAGVDRISWMLVTTLPIETDEEVQRIISSYCIRWQIEIYQARYIARNPLYLLAA